MKQRCIPTWKNVLTIQLLIMVLQCTTNDEKILELIWKYLSFKDKLNCTLVCQKFIISRKESNNIFDDYEKPVRKIIYDNEKETINRGSSPVLLLEGRKNVECTKNDKFLGVFDLPMLFSFKISSITPINRTIEGSKLDWYETKLNIMWLSLFNLSGDNYSEEQQLHKKIT